MILCGKTHLLMLCVKRDSGELDSVYRICINTLINLFCLYFPFLNMHITEKFIPKSKSTVSESIKKILCDNTLCHSSIGSSLSFSVVHTIKDVLDLNRCGKLNGG